MRQKKLIIGLLVMLALVVSGFTYAYWTAGVTGNNDTAEGSIEIGEGAAVTTTVAVGDETSVGELVPSGFEDDLTTFDVVVLTFDVSWTQDATGAEGTTGTLVVEIDSYDIVDALEVTTGLSEVQILAMFDFDIVIDGGASMTLGDSKDVFVTVTFENEPASQAIYDMVAAGTLIFDITFTVGSIVAP